METVAKIDAGLLYRALKATTYAAATKDRREWMNAVHFYADHGTLTVVATNAAIIAVLKANYLGNDFAFSLGTIAAVAALAALDLDGQCVFYTREGMAGVRVSGMDIEAPTPNLVGCKVRKLETVIPHTNNCRVDLERDVLKETLQWSEGIAVRLGFDLEGFSIDGKLSPQPAFDGTPPAEDMHFSREYLLKMLDSFTQPVLSLEFLTDTDPLVIRARNHVAALARMRVK